MGIFEEKIIFLYKNSHIYTQVYVLIEGFIFSFFLSKMKIY